MNNVRKVTAIELMSSPKRKARTAMNEMINICISAQLTLEVFFLVVTTVMVMMTPVYGGSHW